VLAPATQVSAWESNSQRLWLRSREYEPTLTLAMTEIALEKKAHTAS
jgi:hypothetical protein